MNKKHTFLILFLALSISLWGGFSLLKTWEKPYRREIKKYDANKDISTFSTKEFKGFSVLVPSSLEKKIKISGLNEKNLPQLGTDIINLTAQAKGYRLRPSGLKFSSPIEIEIQYDETKIPDGYSEKDILILSYNSAKKSWERLSGSHLQEHKKAIKGNISQSSDFIAGIIKLPESPDTSGFTPTSISGLKAADPLSGVQSIAPPTANPEGSATTSFSIELPKGRAGMQPSISLQYSSDAGHLWLGQGWNLSLPSVNIDTRWGAPRYDAQKETETYTLSGEDLLPNTHRAEWENRTSDKVFYPRREGAFSKIIRKGSHPNNYSWEVSSKSGIITYYGNTTDSRVMTADRNVAHWQISKQQDLKGNTIEYEYTNIEGVLYPKAIYYTGYNGEKGKYSVHFITDADLGENLRPDIQISARLGVKQTYNRLLRKIEVKYDNQMVRSYELIYTEGEYKKTLLKEIRQYDTDGNLFYANAMSYYNDVRDKNGNFIPFGNLEKWNVPKDGIKYEVLGIKGLSGKPSLAGTSDSKSTGNNYRLGVGALGGKFKELTVGGNGGHSKSETRSKVLFQDIDGDNLPDKIFINTDGVFYHKNLFDGKNTSFDKKAKRIVGLSHLGITKNKSHNYGVDLQAYANFGYNWQKSKSITDSYFMDFNGDGLVDFVQGGKVYYNRLVGSEKTPTFSTISTDTPAPIYSGITLQNNATPTITEEELTTQNPLHDVVRTWTAPYSGNILVEHQYQLIENTTPERQDYKTNDGREKADGVKLYIYHKNNKKWEKDIPFNNFSLQTETNTFSVNKGDILYFRVSSKYDGNYDETFWKQDITYTQLTENTDINDIRINKFSSEKDLLWGAKLEHIFSKNTIPTLQGIWEKKVITDQVTLQIIKHYYQGDNLVSNIIAEKTLSQEAQNYDISALNIGSFEAGDFISLRMISPTEINWKNVEFLPKISFLNDENNTETKILPIDYQIFYKLDNHIEPQFLMPSQKGKLRLSITNSDQIKISNAQLNGNILITAKQEGKPVSRKHYQINTGTISDITKAKDNFANDSIKANKTLYFEISFSDKKLFQNFENLDIKIDAEIKDSIKIAETDPRYPNEKYEIITTRQPFRNYASYVLFEHPKVDTKFGKAYRGWGQFVLNGTLAKDHIDETRLVLATENQSAPNTNHFDENDDHSNSEISKKYMLPLTLDIQQPKWSGLEDDIFISQNTFSPSRLGENDLLYYLDTSLSSLQGGESRAISTISESKSKALSFGAGLTGISANKSNSEGENKVIQSMNDFNGDRFPDAIQDGTIYFTSPLGGLSQQNNPHFGNFSESYTYSEGGSVNGSFSHGQAKSTGAPTIYASKSQKVSVSLLGGKDASHITASMTSGSGGDNSIYTHLDINGDGLADRVYGDGRVAYNLGYGFSSEEQWQNIGSQTLSSGTSDDWSAGLGFSLYGGSFTGGINYSRSTSNITTQLLDLNGDGLLDRIEYIYDNNNLTTNKILVYQNLGNRWHSQPMEILVDKKTPIGENTSISWGGNAGFSIGINLWLIRIVPSFGKSIGNNTSRVEATFTDVDGDGHLDYVLSEDEDDLRVATSNFKRTNLLKSVSNGAGNSWEIDYERKAPTYENPNSAWVLKSVKLFDGHIGDGEDYTISHFEYEKPYYDRRERTFYGYEIVKQQAINPQDNSVLRTSVQEFYNQDYFRKSLLKSAYTLGKNGQKLNENIIKYHISNARTGQVLDLSYQPHLLTLPELDSETLFIAPSEEIERSYKNTAYLENKTQKQYDQHGNIIHFIDFGNGDAESKLTAQISYYESQSPYYGGIAKKLEVFDFNGVVRKREAEINIATAELIRVKNYLSDTEFAQTDLEYDKFGNLKSITGAENEKGQRAKLLYTYDDATHSHITSIKDQFGYENQMAYDYRFNTPIKTTDRNGETMTYTLDPKGRIATIIAPKEAKAGKSYTIAYRYSPLADQHLKAKSELQPASSQTLNYDPEHNRNIETYTYADGLGRIVQVKKTASIFKAKGQDDEEKHILSGKQIYDALGRVVETYYPTTAEPSEAYRPTPIASGDPRTATIYDDKDRLIEQIFPDGSKSLITYGLSQDANGEMRLATSQTDALGRTSIVYSDAKGQKTKIVQPTGIETKFEYSAIGELTKVIDADGHQTLSEYDLLGRRTKLTHPDAGTTILAYDKASNLIKRQTSQIRDEMPEANILYHYDFNRLQEIKYPKYPDNNVRYHYGKQEEDKGRRGRLWLVEDASGGTEFFYGDMGEVEKEIRTIRISPTEVQTYITEFEYDSWNRIQKMVYPDGETLDFAYNIAGNLISLKGINSSPNPSKGGGLPASGITTSSPSGTGEYSYIKQQGYDEFEQKVYRRLGNDTETFYSYEPVMRRLSGLSAVSYPHSAGMPSAVSRPLMANQYSYDLVGNILSVENAVGSQQTAISQLGGASAYQYEYDELNRLIKAKGSFEGTNNKAEYSLNMSYNRLNSITKKELNYTLNGQDKGYTLDYKYDNPKHPHAPSSISGISPFGGQGTGKPRSYQYDGNGNPTYYDEFKGFRSMVWDEENRLRGINDNGRLHLYTYDHTGERALKSSAESSMAVINGLASAVITHTDDYTAYVSPYFVVQKGKFTKHYFEGATRIVSKLGEGTFSHKNTGIMAGGLDYLKRTQKEEEARQKYIAGLNTPPGPPTQQGIYTTPEWTKQPYPSIDWESISQNQEPPTGWPRYPKFNEPGDVPGPPVQFGEPVTNANVKAGYGFIPNGVEEKNLYFYHPDHLGSSSYITDKEGSVIQHTEYIAFGETFVDEHSVSPTQPYLFNGKELDYETGLYYYGARYYDPKTSLWLNTDPLSGYNPILETEHYIDGQHNGGVHNPMNLNTYTYTYQNPVVYVDPNGKQSYFMGKNGFYMEGDASWGEYIGNVRPSSPYHELTRINGRLYHKNTTNLFVKVGNYLGGNFVEHKPYSSAEESFNEELQWATVGHFAFKGMGIVAGNLLKNAGGSLWKIAPLQRGFVYESMLGLKGAFNIKNYPVIDAFYNGVATSIKTLDVGAKSYLKGNSVYSKLAGYIDDLANFKGTNFGGINTTGGVIKSKVLEVGIPRGATPAQRQQIQKAIEYAAEKDIKMNVRVVN